VFITDKQELRPYQKENRRWQGIPGIEKTRNGRLFATFYSGGTTEGPGNYVLLKYSDDDGDSFSDIIAVHDPKLPRRSFDPCLWIDPEERLWWFWSQWESEQFDGIGGVWYARCDHPDKDPLVWTEPVRFANGVMMNKPTVLRNGNWLFPCAIWTDHCYNGMPRVDGLRSERKSNVYLSADRGLSFTLHGQADIPDRAFDEHMVLELNDGRLLMLVRTKYGIGQSFSEDGGKNWSPGEDSKLGGPCSRFFIRRLRSGRILLVNHYQFRGRNNLTAMLSEDECESWKGFLLLDERDQVSYPDGVEDDKGSIYIIYDRERGAAYNKDLNVSDMAKEILMAKFTEEDVLAGTPVHPGCRLKIIVDKL
jgi:hypothetical protein